MSIGLPIIRNHEDNFIPSRRHHSAEATEWLEHYMHVNSVMLNTNTRGGGGGGERHVGLFIVDGFSEEKIKYVNICAAYGMDMNVLRTVIKNTETAIYSNNESD